MAEKEYNDMTKLPYSFDLHHDIKYMYEVEMVCDGKCPSGTDATPEDLYELFLHHNMPIPSYLEPFRPVMKLDAIDVWLCADGSWTTVDPLYEEAHKYVKVRMLPTPEFVELAKCRGISLDKVD